MEFVFSDFGVYILDVVLALALGLFVKFIVPYIKSKITTENLSFIKTWVDVAVLAAEQIIKGTGMGLKKKEWVIELLKQLEITVDETVDVMIEASVKALNSATDIAVVAATSAVTEATQNRVTLDKVDKLINTISDNSIKE